MKVNFPCPRCETVVRTEFQLAPEVSPAEITCPACERIVTVADDAAPDGHLKRCLVCPSNDLFIRKDFPQQLGAAIVITGLALSCIPWYLQWWYGTFAILFGTALIDLVLYFTMGDLLECYRCHAQYRGVTEVESHPKFDLETFEKYRQQEARLKKQPPTGRHQEPAGIVAPGENAPHR